jgi:hypothetical protein
MPKQGLKPNRRTIIGPPAARAGARSEFLIRKGELQEYGLGVTPTDARYGLGVTPTDARAHRWISVWMTEHNPHAALHVLPRVVPEGWRFEIYLPPDVPICRAMIPEGW